MVLQRLKSDPPVTEIISRLAGHGYEGWIVGGAVRDLLLGIQPKDYDIATSATPEEVKKVFGRQSRIIGRRFRLVHVILNGNTYEVCTFRRDPTPGERSTRDGDDGVMIWNDNVYGTRVQDASRRDFTVNAMFFNPLGEGELYDPHRGEADIRNRVVRAIGDPAVRLAEDPVRIIRALKLVAHFDFTLEPALEQAIHEQAPKLALSSTARLFEELLKVLGKPCALKMFELCRRFGVLAAFFPRVDACWETADGHLLRQLLSIRDRRLAAGVYAKSQTMGLATVALAPVASALRQLSGAAAPLWLPAPEMASCARDTLRRLFEPYAMPRFLQARVRDTLMLLPAFLEPGPDDFVVRHPQYRYARELFSMFAEHHGWDAAELEQWPAPPRFVAYTGEAARGGGGGDRSRRPRYRGGRSGGRGGRPTPSAAGPGGAGA
ncbi:MAG: hypothetical protein WC789_01140 [Lentisphaeria bacterium]|jgi:poly(A) polymerase